MRIPTANSQDCFYTPEVALEPIYELLEPYRDYTIWEPCCGKYEENQLIKALKARGFHTHASDICYGSDHDFLKMKMPITDPPIKCIVTNPPYSLVTPMMRKCYEHNVQFFLLLPLDKLGGKERQKMYREFGIHLMLLGGRVNFRAPFSTISNPTFETGWFYRYGDEQLTFTTLSNYGNRVVEPTMLTRPKSPQLELC